MSVVASPTETATARQRAAADPRGSAWVVASAGSGKTQVLTNRILRLLLAGCAPESLLCLTYTRAAAANMATRLHRDLSAWARPGAKGLAGQLTTLLGTPPGEAQLDRARRLLAEALDAPGGMRIGTLHSFAQMLLRRFPLEAGVAPHFALLDDADRAELLRDAREGVFAAAADDAALDTALDRLARRFAPKQFGELMNTLVTGASLPHGRAAMLACFGLPGDASAAGLLAEASCGADAPALRAAAAALAQGSGPEQARARAMRGWLEGDATARAAAWDDWCDVFLKQDGGARSTLANKPTETAFPGTVATMRAEAERILDLRARQAALETAEITGALATLAAPIFARFRAAKQVRAALDYDDLISGAETLLGGDDAPWVLFRLDARLDHLLIDEAQDTAPAQWAIAQALSAEFFAGAGSRRDAVRTVFAVGDPKQSIFSFQGADVAAFGAAARDFARAAAPAQPFQVVDLPVSFRSAQAVLDVVNAIPGTGWPRHQAARAGQAGTVELWPLVEPPPKPEDPFAVDPPPQADELCARQLAATLAGWIGTLDMPARGRTLAAGDILVLVRRRRAFVGHLTRALKQAGVAVAGLDRLRLTESLAVQDCLAFLDCLLLPEDDLTLAAVLKGPFCALDEDSLMTLAIDRGNRRLIAALNTRRAERADWGQAAALLERFRGRADFADAHALLAELLDHPVPDAPTGRAALIARLGEQAVEPLDELLRAALADGLRHPPSLQGFLHRLRTANAEIKRDADLSSDAVRIMTVHGAKGLQAPLVVLADTMSLPEPPKALIGLDGLPAWLPPKLLRPAALQAAADEARARALAEHERLLYVALTRAEERLLVVGWNGRRPLPAADAPFAWHGRIAAAFDALDAAEVEQQGVGLVRRHATPQTAAPDQAKPEAARPRPTGLPGWARTPAAAEAPAVARIKPSGEDGTPEEPPAQPPFAAEPRAAARLRRGDLTHVLLQYLPTLPAGARPGAAQAWLARNAGDLDPGLAAAIAAEALGVLAHPDSAALFDEAGLAEAPIVGEVAGRPVNGVIDRLVIRPDRVLLVDFKTDRAPPSSPEAAPPKYLRQLAIYRALLARLFPDRSVEAALVWTALPAVMRLPAALLDQAMPATRG